jgi:hypothetical protein
VRKKSRDHKNFLSHENVFSKSIFDFSFLDIFKTFLENKMLDVIVNKEFVRVFLFYECFFRFYFEYIKGYMVRFSRYFIFTVFHFHGYYFQDCFFGFYFENIKKNIGLLEYFIFTVLHFHGITFPRVFFYILF